MIYAIFLYEGVLGSLGSFKDVFGECSGLGMRRVIGSLKGVHLGFRV